ncbi:hypothetical protein KGF57_003931 [Candida theae]|uniref:Uncharacterized protein n=1 Tax=Candida theae TaxID=1198502 RepID=A0AAD5BBZ6_9ASCO|nr:uncharacterized protein KGF57_003931 [Candida theae]KAI5953722.1 hypothetical protein KGF57_003931 [Candida theae]
MIQRKATMVESRLTEQSVDQNGAAKSSSWSLRQKKSLPISIPEPKPFKSQENQGEVGDDKPQKRRHWLHKSSGVTSSMKSTAGKTPDNLVTETKPSTETKSKRWWERGSQKGRVVTPATLASSESEPHDLLSTESIDIAGSNVISVIKSLEVDDSRPIVFGNYSGEPVYKRNITEPALFNSEILKFYQFDTFEEATYHSWNVWTVGDDGAKGIDRSIECKMDLVDFFKRFEHEKVYIMRSILVPNLNQFKNGYLVKLKILHGKEPKGAEIGLQAFKRCCKSSILNKVPDNAIKINICGLTYTRRGSLTQITLWIHPIMNMSFNISSQVMLLIRSLSLEAKVDKITLVDVNNGSKTEIVED